MSNWGSYVLYDPLDMEKIFSQEDSMSNLPSVWEEVQDESLSDLGRVSDLLDLLPPREADFIELYFFKKIRQTCIAELFNVSQPTVCYRLQRGAARLKYLLALPPISFPKMEADLKAFLADPKDAEIMMGMLRTTCQSDVARELGVTQGFVRHRFYRTLAKLKTKPEMTEYVEVFEQVGRNLNVMKNISRFTWPDEVLYSVY